MIFDAEFIITFIVILAGTCIGIGLYKVLKFLVYRLTHQKQIEKIKTELTECAFALEETLTKMFVLIQFDTFSVFQENGRNDLIDSSIDGAHIKMLIKQYMDEVAESPIIDEVLDAIIAASSLTTSMNWFNDYSPIFVVGMSRLYVGDDNSATEDKMHEKIADILGKTVHNEALNRYDVEHLTRMVIWLVYHSYMKGGVKILSSIFTENGIRAMNAIFDNIGDYILPKIDMIEKEDRVVYKVVGFNYDTDHLLEQLKLQ